jgi:ABC-type glycerol-3-phosphate transport system substrate-binding protein
MNFTKNQLIIIGVVGSIVIVFILGLLGIIPGFKKSASIDPNYPTGPVSLTMWGVGDEYSAYGDTVKAYQQLFPNVKINYVKYDDPNVYENELINAFAENRGPDIFMVKNDWVYQHWGKMLPANSFANVSLITPQQVQALFPSVVSNDFVLSGGIYALPLNMDTLALIYNKDIFASDGIVFPPTTWDELVADVTKIRQVDQNKKITLSAIALGGAYNVSNLSDILSVLALQSGSKINSPNGTGVLFDSVFQNVVKFYTQFSDPINPYYTWNESFGNSITSFASGKTAMVLDYYSSLADIKNRNPYLNYGVALLPQTSPQSASQIANYASYWGLAVSKQTKYAYPAWNFVVYLTTSPQISAAYTQATNKLPALLSLINQGLGGDNGVFLRQALTAKTWLQADPQAIESAFEGMVNDILSGKVDLQNAVKAAENSINKMYQPVQTQ